MLHAVSVPPSFFECLCLCVCRFICVCICVCVCVYAYIWVRLPQASEPALNMLHAPLSLCVSMCLFPRFCVCWWFCVCRGICVYICACVFVKRAGPKGLRAESARAFTGRRKSYSGRGEDFWNRQPIFFTETAVTPERKVEKWFPRWEINRHAEG